jgi:5'-nucleotidase/UDP-sugar diphosphatase
MLVGSGSIRTEEIGPLVTLKDLSTCFPFDDTLTRYAIDGEKLKRVFAHIMRPENRNGEGECYQVNGKVRATYSDALKQLTSLKIDSKEVSDTELYKVCMQGYHFKNSEANLNITSNELLESGKSKVVSTSAHNVLDEYLRCHQNISRVVEGRLTYLS